MTTKEWLERYNAAPWDLETCAGSLEAKITDDPDLVQKAKEYLNAMNALQEALSKIGFEFG